MKQDLVYALRLLARRPGFAALAILTLALGIGANTVIFSGVYTLLLQPLPYPGADRLVLITQTSRAGVDAGNAYAEFEDWKRQSASFEGFAAYRSATVNLMLDPASSQAVERASGSYVSAEFLPLLGARARLGRIFLPAEHRAGASRAIVLGHLFWQLRLGGDPKVIGREIRLNDETFTIVGVLGEEFLLPFRAQFWTPLEAAESPESLSDRANRNHEVIGRVRNGMSMDAARRELGEINDRAAREHGLQLQAARQTTPQVTLQITRLRDALPGMAKYGAPLAALQIAVVLVLLIASVNLANLLLARHTERRTEFAVRLSLGATRSRLVRQLVTEAALIGAAGCALGLAGARWGIEYLSASFAARIPGAAEVGINPPVLLFTLGVSLVVTLGFGLVPALLASRQDLNEWLKAGSGSTTNDRRSRRLSGALITAEVALAVMLLTTAGLMIRTFLNLTKEDPGFRPERAVSVSLTLSPSRYATPESLAAYYDEAIRRIETLPGVEAVGGIAYMPLVGYNPGTNFSIEGRNVASPDEKMRADYQPVTPGYFRAIGMPLLSGREFTPADLKPSPEVAIVNRAFARKFFETDDALGRRLFLEKHDAPMAIIGVVGDVRQFGLQNEPRPEIYLPSYNSRMTLIARTTGDPSSLIAPLRETVREVDEGAALGLKTMEDVVSDSLERRRLLAGMLGTLSAAALVLAMLGIYGVISYTTAQRKREFGLRLALGAQGSDLARLVVRQAMRLVATGVAAGMIGSLALTRVIKSMLYGVTPTDPLTLAGIGALLAVVALAASYLPARRAARVDPLSALRYE